MGHLINPINFRIGYSRKNTNRFSSFNDLNYNYNLTEISIVNNVVKAFFAQKLFYENYIFLNNVSAYKGRDNRITIHAELFSESLLGVGFVLNNFFRYYLHKTLVGWKTDVKKRIKKFLSYSNKLIKRLTVRKRIIFFDKKNNYLGSNYIKRDMKKRIYLYLSNYLGFVLLLKYEKLIFYNVYNFNIRFINYLLVRNLIKALNTSADKVNFHLTFVKNLNEITPYTINFFVEKKLQNPKASIFEVLKEMCIVLNLGMHRYVSMNFFEMERVFPTYRGYKIACSGRLTKKQRASFVWKKYSTGQLPFSSMGGQIIYDARDMELKYGSCGIKTWVTIFDKRFGLTYISMGYFKSNKRNVVSEVY